MGASQSTSNKFGGMDPTNENNTNINKTTNHAVSTGQEYYDKIDQLASELPHVIDEESRIQVEDYKQACDNGKGPMVACFATAEFISLYERKHHEAAQLYRNVCYRPKTDKSPNGIYMSYDQTKAYPPGCYNLAKMLMTGKGGIPIDRVEAYQLFDRACQANHGGACYLQAQILCTSQNSLAEHGIPHDPYKAMELYQKNCDDIGDTIR
jgi:TPR repeat protein